jgi:hypothetical protein
MPATESVRARSGGVARMARSHGEQRQRRGYSNTWERAMPATESVRARSGGVARMARSHGEQR